MYNASLNISLQASRSDIAKLRNQIESSLRGVGFSINSTNITRANTAIGNLAATTKKASKEALTFSDIIALKGVNFVQYTIATTFVLKLAGAISTGVRESIQFEKEMAVLAQTVNKTNTETLKYSQSILNISKSYGLAQKKTAELVRILAQAGLTIKEATSAADVLARTTLIGTFDDLNSTTEAFIALMASFKMDVDDAAKALDAINSVSKRYAVESADLVEAIKRTGGAFKAAGGDINELIALFTSVRSFSRESADTIATAFRTIFARVSRPKTIEYFRQLGIELTNLKGDVLDPFNAIKALSEGLNKLGIQAGSVKFAEVVEQIGGIRQISKVIPLINNFSNAQKALKIANEGVAESDADVAKAKETLAFKIQALKENFSSLITEITQTSNFKVLANIIISMANGVVELTRSLKNLIPVLGLLGAVRLGGAFSRMLTKGRASSIVGSGSGIIGANKGGFIPGTGDTDTVPAMLTPGEFVINKKSAKAFGYGNLRRINKYAKGGLVGKVQKYNEGGKVVPGWEYDDQSGTYYPTDPSNPRNMANVLRVREKLKRAKEKLAKEQSDLNEELVAQMEQMILEIQKSAPEENIIGKEARKEIGQKERRYSNGFKKGDENYYPELDNEPVVDRPSVVERFRDRRSQKSESAEYIEIVESRFREIESALDQERFAAGIKTYEQVQRERADEQRLKIDQVAASERESSLFDLEYPKERSQKRRSNKSIPSVYDRQMSGRIANMAKEGRQYLLENPEARQRLLSPKSQKKFVETKSESLRTDSSIRLPEGFDIDLDNLTESSLQELLKFLDEKDKKTAVSLRAYFEKVNSSIQSQSNPTSFQEAQAVVEDQPIVAPLPNAVPLPPKKKKPEANTPSFQETAPSVEQQINNTVSERSVVEEERLAVARESLKQESEASKATPIPQIVTATASIAEAKASRTKLMRKRKAIEEAKKIEEMKTAEFQIGSTPSSPEEKRRNKEAKKTRRELRKKQKYSEEMYPFFRSNKHFSDMDQNEFDEWFRREKLDPGSIASWERERRDKATAAATKNKDAGFPAPPSNTQKTIRDESYAINKQLLREERVAKKRIAEEMVKKQKAAQEAQKIKDAKIEGRTSKAERDPSYLKHIQIRRGKRIAARREAEKAAKSNGYPPPSPERLATMSLFQGGAATLQPETYQSGKTQKAPRDAGYLDAREKLRKKRLQLKKEDVWERARQESQEQYIEPMPSIKKQKKASAVFQRTLKNSLTEKGAFSYFSNNLENWLNNLERNKNDAEAIRILNELQAADKGGNTTPPNIPPVAGGGGGGGNPPIPPNIPPISGGGNLGPVSPQQTASVGVQIGEKIGGSIISKLSGGLGGIAALLAPQILESFQGGDQTTQNKLFDAFVSLTSKTAQLGIQASIAKSAFTSLGDAVKEGVRKYRESTRVREELDKRLKVAKEAEYFTIKKLKNTQQEYADQLMKSKASTVRAFMEEDASVRIIRNAPSEYEQKRQNSLQAVSSNSSFSQRVFQQNPSLNQVANAQQNITPPLNNISQDRSEIGALGLASIEYEETRRSAAQTGADKQYKMQGKGQKRRKNATERLNKEVAELTNIYGANSQELKDVQDILERYKNSVIRQDAAVQAYSQAMRKATEKVNSSVLSVKPAGVFGPESNLTGSASIQSRISTLQGKIQADEATIANDPNLKKLAKAQQLLATELETAKKTYGENSTELNDVNTILGMYPDNVILQLAAVKKYTTTVNKARASLDQTIATANNTIASAKITAIRDQQLAAALKRRAEEEQKAADAASQEVKQTQSAIDRRGLFGGYKQDVATVYGKSRGIFGFGKQRSLPETATDDERMAFQAAQGRIGNVKAGLGMAVGATMTVGVGAASASYDYAAKNLRQLADSAIQAGSAQEAYTTTLEALNAEATSNNITNYASIGAGIGSMLGPYGAAIGMGLGALAAVYLGDVTDYIGLTNKAQERELAARNAATEALSVGLNKSIDQTSKAFNNAMRSDASAAGKIATKGIAEVIDKIKADKNLTFYQGAGKELSERTFDQGLAQLEQLASSSQYAGKTMQELSADPAFSSLANKLSELAVSIGQEDVFKSYMTQINASNTAIRIERENRLRLIAIQTQEIATRNSIANTLVAWDNALIKTSKAIQELDFKISRSQASATFDTSLTDLSARNIRSSGFMSSLRATSELSPELRQRASGVYNALSQTQGLGMRLANGNIQDPAIQQSIRNAFSGLDPKIAEDLITRLIGGEITSANIDEEIAKSLQPFVETLEDGRKSINDNLENQAKLQEKQLEYEQKVLDMKLETIKSQEKADRAIGEIFNVFTTASEEVDNRIRKANIALRKTGVVGQLTGGPQDLKIIALRDEEIKQRQKEINARLADSRSSAQERFALQAEFSSLTAESAKLNQAMSILADTSEEVSAAQRELEQSQEIRKAFKDAAIQLAFGTTESRNEFFKTKNQAFATSAFGTAEVIPEEDRSGVLSFLQQFKNFRGFAGGQTGGEVIQRVAANYLAQIGVPLQEIPNILDDFIASEMSLVDIQRRALQLDADRNEILYRIQAGLNPAANPPQRVQNAPMFNKGGIVYQNTGGSIFKPKGTDTVPAMLTPGEFVVKRDAVQKYGTGMLKEINSGYYQDGGLVGGAAGFNKSPKQNIISGDQAKKQFLIALNNKNIAQKTKIFDEQKTGSAMFNYLLNSGIYGAGLVLEGSINDVRGDGYDYYDIYDALLNAPKFADLKSQQRRAIAKSYYNKFLQSVVNREGAVVTDGKVQGVGKDPFAIYQDLIDSLFGMNTGGAGKDSGDEATASGNLAGFYVNRKGQFIFETGENFQQIDSGALPGAGRGTREENIINSFKHVSSQLRNIGFFEAFPQYRTQFDNLRDSLIRPDQIDLFKPTNADIQQEENEKKLKEQLKKQREAAEFARKMAKQQAMGDNKQPQIDAPKNLDTKEASKIADMPIDKLVEAYSNKASIFTPQGMISKAFDLLSSDKQAPATTKQNKEKLDLVSRLRNSLARIEKQYDLLNYGENHNAEYLPSSGFGGVTPFSKDPEEQKLYKIFDEARDSQKFYISYGTGLLEYLVENPSAKFDTSSKFRISPLFESKFYTANLIEHLNALNEREMKANSTFSYIDSLLKQRKKRYDLEELFPNIEEYDADSDSFVDPYEEYLKAEEQSKKDYDKTLKERSIVESLSKETNIDRFFKPEEKKPFDWAGSFIDTQLLLEKLANPQAELDRIKKQKPISKYDERSVLPQEQTTPRQTPKLGKESSSWDLEATLSDTDQGGPRIINYKDSNNDSRIIADISRITKRYDERKFLAEKERKLDEVDRQKEAAIKAEETRKIFEAEELKKYKNKEEKEYAEKMLLNARLPYVVSQGLGFFGTGLLALPPQLKPQDELDRLDAQQKAKEDFERKVREAEQKQKAYDDEQLRKKNEQIAKKFQEDVATKSKLPSMLGQALGFSGLGVFAMGIPTQEELTKIKNEDLRNKILAEEKAAKEREGERIRKLQEKIGKEKAKKFQEKVATDSLLPYVTGQAFGYGLMGAIPIGQQASRYASGGLVDSIPARLTAGEFVMSKKATESIGPRNLANMNKSHGYSTGGYVTKKGPAYLQGGGTVRGGVDQNIGLSASQLMQFNNKFSDTVQKLIEMPKVFEISLETVGVNVNLNGAEFLAKLPSVLQSIILEKIQSEIGNIAAKVKQNLMSGN